MGIPTYQDYSQLTRDIFGGARDQQLIARLGWASYLEILLILRATFISLVICNAFLTTSIILHLVSGQPSDDNPTNVLIFHHLVQLASCAYFYLYPEELFWR